MPNTAVSCLCVGWPDNWGQLQRAINCFAKQRYADRELLITTGSKSFADLVIGYIFKHKIDKVGVTVHESIRTEADGLALALMRASGRFVTVWEPCDLSAPYRISSQLLQIAGHGDPEGTRIRVPHVTAYARPFFYFRDTHELFPVMLDRPELASEQRLVPQTVMATRERFPLPLGQYRDSAVVSMAKSLFRDREPVILETSVGEYVVGITHDTLPSYDYYRGIAQQYGLSCKSILETERPIRSAIQQFTWDSPSLSVCGRDGTAFTVDATSLATDQLPDVHPVAVTDPAVTAIEETLL